MLFFSSLLGGLIQTAQGNAWGTAGYGQSVPEGRLNQHLALAYYLKEDLRAAKDTTQRRCSSLLPGRLETRPQALLSS